MHYPRRKKFYWWVTDLGPLELETVNVWRAPMKNTKC